MLKGLGCLVTGGASGLGKATVERLVRQGRKVVILDIDGKKAKAVAKEHDKNVIASVGCVTSEKDVKSALDLTKTFGGLGLIVNCAGIFELNKIFNVEISKECTTEHFNRALSINSRGTFNLIKFGSELMKKNEMEDNGQRGIIINTASVLAFDGDVGHSCTAASSGAIVAMTQPVARDLAILGIRVMTIATGLFDTPLLKEIPYKLKHYIGKTTPFPQRLGKPEEYVQVVTTIIENPMLNGSVIRLDGGQRWHIV